MTPSLQTLVRLLKTPIKTVEHNKQRVAFHLNTKFAHLLGDWAHILPADTNPKGNEPTEATKTFPLWLALAGDFVACLPDIEVEDGDGDGDGDGVVNPFTYLRQAFPSNRKSATEQIPKIVAAMWELTKPFQAESPGFAQDHRNLVELATLCGFISKETEKAFLKEAFGMNKTTEELVDDILNEAEGDVLLGTMEKIPLLGGTLMRPSQKGSNWCVRENTLFIEGTGCISEFSLIRHENQICVIDFKKLPQTSVTNLTESVLDAIKTTFGENAEVFEAYPEDLESKTPYLTRITPKVGGPCWEQTSTGIEDLLKKVQTAKDCAKS